MIENQQKYKDVSYEYKRIIKNNKKCDAIMTTFLGQPCFLGIKQDFNKYLFQNEKILSKSMLEFGFHELIKNGLLYTSGKQWKYQRSVISKLFHYQKLQDKVPVINQIADIVIKKFYEKKGQIINVQQECAYLTSKVVERTFFSEDLSEIIIDGKSVSEELSDIYQTTFYNNTQSIYIQLKNLFFGQYAASIQFLYSKKEKELFSRIQNLKAKCQEVIEKRIKEFNKDAKRDDFLDVFISEYKQGSYEKDDIIYQFLTFFSAGTDTVATSLSNTFYVLSKHEKIQEKLRDELKNCQTSEEYFKNDYLHCVVREILRHTQALTLQMPRQVQQDFMVQDYCIKKGWYVTASLQAEMYNPEVYPEPFSFKPERWMNTEGNIIETNNYLPFSQGPRNCIGQHLAMMEMKILIAKTIKNFDIKLGVQEDQEYIVKPLYSTLNQSLVYLKEVEK